VVHTWWERASVSDAFPRLALSRITHPRKRVAYRLPLRARPAPELIRHGEHIPTHPEIGVDLAALVARGQPRLVVRRHECRGSRGASADEASRRPVDQRGDGALAVVLAAAVQRIEDRVETFVGHGHLDQR
jgi:hypothetical protein